MTDSNDSGVFFGIVLAIFGLNRAGQILYAAVFVLAVPALLVWFVVLPRARFSKQDELLFRAARHGDRAGVERALNEGADINAVAPVDRQTALDRAAIFGHVEVVRFLLERGANSQTRGNDGRSALEIARDAHDHEKDPEIGRRLDAVIDALEKVSHER